MFEMLKAWRVKLEPGVEKGQSFADQQIRSFDDQAEVSWIAETRNEAHAPSADAYGPIISILKAFTTHFILPLMQSHHKKQDEKRRHNQPCLRKPTHLWKWMTFLKGLSLSDLSIFAI